MNGDELQLVIVFVLPWVGLPIGAGAAYVYSHNAGSRKERARLKRNLLLHKQKHPMVVNSECPAPCPKQWYAEQFAVPLAMRTVNW